jgi:hypothetical protein
MNFRRRKPCVQIIRLGRTNYMKAALVIVFDLAIVALVVFAWYANFT